MTNEDRRLDKYEIRLTALENKFDVLMTKLDMFIEETRENRRRQDTEMQNLNAKIDATVRGMLGGMFVTVILGIGAMIIATLTK